MPVLDGIKATMRIRDIETKSLGSGHCAIIGITAEDATHSQQECISAGMYVSDLKCTHWTTYDLFPHQGYVHGKTCIYQVCGGRSIKDCGRKGRAKKHEDIPTAKQAFTCPAR